MTSVEDRAYADYHGFIDWYFLFPGQNVMWTVVGTVFLIVTLISYCPQLIDFIKIRSSFGVSGSYVVAQALGLFFLAYNVICLKSTDFVGIFQYSGVKVYARLLTFANLFLQFVFYLPSLTLTFIFHDRMERETRGDDSIKREWNSSRFFAVFGYVLFAGLFMLWFACGFALGFNAPIIQFFGRTAGVIAFIMELVQFIPQLITTVKLKDNGSLSLLMLEIQAPTNLANGLFMWLGQGDDITTFASAMLDATQEFTLLSMCIFYKWRRRQGKEKVTDFSAISMSLLERIEPVPISSHTYLNIEL